MSLDGRWAGLARGRGAEIVRYLLAGGFITALAHLAYLFFLWLGMGPHLAWALSFVFGTVLGYLIHRSFVFQVPARRHHWWSFPAVYLGRFLLGQLLLTAFLWAGLSAGWAGFWVNALMAPLGYVLLRAVLRWA